LYYKYKWYPVLTGEKFELPPALAGGTKLNKKNGFSLIFYIFWLKPLILQNKTSS